MPGPACYGHGGTEPTVTDANVVLGYLPSALLGGEFKVSSPASSTSTGALAERVVGRSVSLWQLDVEASKAAVSKVADRLKMTVYDAAKGIIDIVNEKMFGALRLVSVEQGPTAADTTAAVCQD